MKQIKLSFHMPIHRREKLRRPYMFIQNGLRCFLLDKWQNKELWIADDPNSKLDINKEIWLAKKACFGDTNHEVPIRYFKCKTHLVGAKRTGMAQRADADVFVQRDDDDLYLPMYGTMIGNHLQKNKNCPGNIRTRKIVYFVHNRRYGWKKSLGCSGHVFRANLWRKLKLQYQTDRLVGEDKALYNLIERKYPRIFRQAEIRGLGRHLIVIWLGVGHLSEKRSRTWRKVVGRKSKIDRDGSWLINHVPEPLVEHYQDVFNRDYEKRSRKR